MTKIQISPSDIRVGDVIAGRRVTALELTRHGIAVARVGINTREVFTDALVEVNRPDRVAMQAIVQSSAIV
jgi:hypothetical protein